MEIIARNYSVNDPFLLQAATNQITINKSKNHYRYQQYQFYQVFLTQIAENLHTFFGIHFYYNRCQKSISLNQNTLQKDFDSFHQYSHISVPYKERLKQPFIPVARSPQKQPYDYVLQKDYSQKVSQNSKKHPCKRRASHSQKSSILNYIIPENIDQVFILTK